MITVKVATAFSRYPAGRTPNDGPFSGEAFRKQHLEPFLKRDETVVVDLDGTRGYGSSFLEEAFGGLVRAGIQVDALKRLLRLEGGRASVKTEIEDYIAQAASDGPEGHLERA